VLTAAPPRAIGTVALSPRCTARISRPYVTAIAPYGSRLYGRRRRVSTRGSPLTCTWLTRMAMTSRACAATVAARNQCRRLSVSPSRPIASAADFAAAPSVAISAQARVNGAVPDIVSFATTNTQSSRITGPIRTGAAACTRSAGRSGTTRRQPTTTAAVITVERSSQNRVRSRREANPSGMASRASISTALPADRVTCWTGPPVAAAGAPGAVAAVTTWARSPAR
jgi:hypothetical protein